MEYIIYKHPCLDSNLELIILASCSFCYSCNLIRERSLEEEENFFSKTAMTQNDLVLAGEEKKGKEGKKREKREKQQKKKR